MFFREADIIYHEKFDPIFRKREVSHVIACQMVSLEFYSVPLWSKEGFITFFGMFILDEVVYP